MKEFRITFSQGIVDKHERFITLTHYCNKSEIESESLRIAKENNWQVKAIFSVELSLLYGERRFEKC